MAYDSVKKAEYQKAYKAKNRNRILEYKRKWKANNYEATIWDNAKHRAKRKGLEFNIEISDIVIPEICPALKMPLKMNVGGQRHDSPSLDRIDNSKGYIKGNIMIISNLANIMKSYATPHQLRLFAQWVFDTYKEEDVNKTSRNDITGDWIQSKPNSEQFEKNFDLIFRKKNPNQEELFKEPMPHEEFVKSMLQNEEVYKEVARIEKEESRIEVIGQNGNEGIHYEYELDKSTGEVVKKDE